MKLTLNPVCLAGILFFVIICFPVVDSGISSNIVGSGLPSDLSLVQPENRADGVVPSENGPIEYFIKVRLAPTPYNDFFTIRPAPPVWEKTLSEYVPFPINFFCPIMVLIFFIYFYQSSRNGAELDYHLYRMVLAR